MQTAAAVSQSVSSQSFFLHSTYSSTGSSHSEVHSQKHECLSFHRKVAFIGDIKCIYSGNVSFNGGIVSGITAMVGNCCTHNNIHIYVVWLLLLDCYLVDSWDVSLTLWSDCLTPVSMGTLVFSLPKIAFYN